MARTKGAAKSKAKQNPVLYKENELKYLSTASNGIVFRRMFLFLYGTPKTGKTTFASDFPGAFIIDVENGSAHLNTTRFVPKTYPEVVGALKELVTDPHEFKTVIIDSLDHLEPMIWANVCLREGASSIEKVGGGYAKGYIEALKECSEVIQLLKRCRDERGMNVIVIAHSHIKTVNDPTQMLAHDRYEPKLHHKASALFKENADAILFTRIEEVIVKQGGQGKGKATGEGRRVLLTNGLPGYEAGNRLGLPPVLPLSYDAFMEAVAVGTPEAPEVVSIQIKGLIAQVKDPATKAKAEEAFMKANSDSVQLSKIRNRLEVITATA